jgi:hypothetical protein
MFPYSRKPKRILKEASNSKLTHTALKGKKRRDEALFVREKCGQSNTKNLDSIYPIVRNFQP